MNLKQNKKCKTKQNKKNLLITKDRDNQRYMAFFFHSKAYIFSFKKDKKEKEKKKRIKQSKTKQNKKVLIQVIEVRHSLRTVL